MAVPDTSAHQKLFRLVGPAVPIKNFSDWLGQLCLSRLRWYLGLDVAKVPTENFLVLQLFTHVKFSIIKYSPTIL